jgi:ABC-type microcin C transport system permease subunit YejB
LCAPIVVILSEEFVKKLMERIGKFFVPEPGASRWTYAMPYLVLIILFIIIFAGGTYAWERH